jgi:hypothetical protein
MELAEAMLNRELCLFIREYCGVAFEAGEYEVSNDMIVPNNIVATELAFWQIKINGAGNYEPCTEDWYEYFAAVKNNKRVLRIIKYMSLENQAKVYLQYGEIMRVTKNKLPAPDLVCLLRLTP